MKFFVSRLCLRGCGEAAGSCVSASPLLSSPRIGNGFDNSETTITTSPRSTSPHLTSPDPAFISPHPPTDSPPHSPTESPTTHLLTQ